MAGLLTFSLRDYDKEISTTSINTGAVTAVSLPGLLAEIGTLRDAIDNITLGVLAREQLTAFNTPLSNNPATLPNAQRETKWLVLYEDNTQFFDPPVNAIPNEGYRKRFVLEIPTANLNLLAANSDLADTTNPAIQAFIDAFEQTGRSPYGGSVNVIEIRHVSRNL